MALPDRTFTSTLEVGTVAQPTNGRVTATMVKADGVYRLDFVLKGVRIPVTDGTTSGSYGSVKIFDFNEGAINFLGCRQDYTKYSSDGTGVPNDTAFVIAVGTGAVGAAADGALTGTSVNIGATVSQTLSSGTTTGTGVTGAQTTAINGTATPADININWSGSAATVDGNGWIQVTGTISVSFVWLGDD